MEYEDFNNLFETTLQRMQAENVDLAKRPEKEVGVVDEFELISQVNGMMEENMSICSESDDIVAKKVEILSKVYDRKTYSCDICDKVFYERYLLTLHKCWHISRTYKCAICESLFGMNKSLFKHVLEHHTELLLCEICDSSKVVAIVNLRKHFQRRHSFIYYKCNFCTETFFMKYFFVNHMVGKHNMNVEAEIFANREYICLQCNLNFKSAAEVQSHLNDFKDIHKTMPIPMLHVDCQLCLKEFSNNKLLEQHYLLCFKNNFSAHTSTHTLVF